MSRSYPRYHTRGKDSYYAERVLADKRDVRKPINMHRIDREQGGLHKMTSYRGTYFSVEKFNRDVLRRSLDHACRNGITFSAFRQKWFEKLGRNYKEAFENELSDMVVTRENKWIKELDDGNKIEVLHDSIYRVVRGSYYISSNDKIHSLDNVCTAAGSRNAYRKDVPSFIIEAGKAFVWEECRFEDHVFRIWYSYEFLSSDKFEQELAPVKKQNNESELALRNAIEVAQNWKQELNRLGFYAEEAVALRLRIQDCQKTVDQLTAQRGIARKAFNEYLKYKKIDDGTYRRQSQIYVNEDTRKQVDSKMQKHLEATLEALMVDDLPLAV